jgi:outer membrane protein assembly factor BamA
MKLSRRPTSGCPCSGQALALAIAFALESVAAPALASSPLDRLRYQEFPELEGKRVSRVLLFGNNHTRDVVLLREMRTEEGAPFVGENLWRDWERLVDLGIFAEVEVEAVPSEDEVLVVVSVYERPRWFVAPIVDYDIDGGDLTVGYRLRFRNFDGLNRRIRSKGQIGEKDRLSFSWESPWLGRHRQPLSLDLRLELPRPDLDELRTSSVGVATTRFLGDYKKVRKGVGAFGRLDILDRDGTHPEGPVHQLSPVIGLSYFRDKRNVRVDPTRGTLFSTGTALVSGWTTDEISYWRSTIDGRAFLRVWKGTVLAGRATTVLSTGEIPDYRRLGIGGGGSVRGQPTDVETGNNLARASLEWRFPILGQRRYLLRIPFVPQRISNFDLRIDGEIFVDAGTAWDDSVGFRSARVRTGAGVGLRVFVPVVELARFELAFDPSGSPSLYLREGNII